MTAAAPGTASDPRPLAGLRVIEFSQMVMGPSCGLILADLGADVMKVEPPKGTAPAISKVPPPASSPPTAGTSAVSRWIRRPRKAGTSHAG